MVVCRTFIIRFVRSASSQDSAQISPIRSLICSDNKIQRFVGFSLSRKCISSSHWSSMLKIWISVLLTTGLQVGVLSGEQNFSCAAYCIVAFITSIMLLTYVGERLTLLSNLMYFRFSKRKVLIIVVVKSVILMCPICFVFSLN